MSHRVFYTRRWAAIIVGLLIALVLACVCLAVAFSAARAQSAVAMPNKKLTPGVAGSSDTSVVCKKGYAASVRSVSRQLRDSVMRDYNLNPRALGYEMDHLIPLVAGGSNSRRNLWPQPRSGVLNAIVKDTLEVYARNLACQWHHFSLDSAQRVFRNDWTWYYRSYHHLSPDSAKRAVEGRLPRGDRASWHLHPLR